MERLWFIKRIEFEATKKSATIACSAEGAPTESGTFLIGLMLANVCRQNVTGFPYEIVRLAKDIAGGLMVAMPSEKDLLAASDDETVVATGHKRRRFGKQVLEVRFDGIAG